jgi:hypothetical protein
VRKKECDLKWVVGKHARVLESKYMYFILGECMYVQGGMEGGVSMIVRLVLTSKG